MQKDDKSFSDGAAHGQTHRTVVYRLQPTTFLGRLIATAVAIAMLLGVMFFSLVLFSILFTAILIIVGYALFRTHLDTKRRGRVTYSEHRDKR